MLQNQVSDNRVLDSATDQSQWDAGEQPSTGLTQLDRVIVREGEGAWHGLETQAPHGSTLDDWARLAGFSEWRIAMRKMYMPNPEYRTTERHDGVYVNKSDFVEVPNARAVTRMGPGDYQEVFGVASKRYVPVQPMAQIEVVRKFMEAGDARLNTLGSLYAGRRVFAMLDLGVSWRVNGNDEVKGMLAVLNSNDGTGAFKVKLTMIRVVCQNTYRRASKGGSQVSIDHRRVWDAQTPADIARMAKLARVEAAKEHETAEALVAAHMTEDQAYEYIARVSGSADAFRSISGRPVEEIDGGEVLARVMENTAMAEDLPKMLVDPSKLNRVGARVLDHMLKGTPGSKPLGADGISAWDAFNHVTYYASHDSRIGRSAARRVESSLDGTAETLKDRAAQTALAMATAAHGARA